MLVLVLAAPAMASHTHVRMTGNGSCVILAANGHEHDVQLPHAGEFAPDRRHPLHVNVHLGNPGTRKVRWWCGSRVRLATLPTVRGMSTNRTMMMSGLPTARHRSTRTESYALAISDGDTAGSARRWT